jgi:hypothetical protein
MTAVSFAICAAASPASCSCGGLCLLVEDHALIAVRLAVYALDGGDVFDLPLSRTFAFTSSYDHHAKEITDAQRT